MVLRKRVRSDGNRPAHANVASFRPGPQPLVISQNGIRMPTSLEPRGPLPPAEPTPPSLLPAAIVVAAVVASCVALLLSGVQLAATLASVSAAAALGLRVARALGSTRQGRGHG